MLFLVCSVILATGAWDCGQEKLSVTEAVSVAYASNKVFPWKPGSARSPYTIWPSDEPTPDKR